MDHYILTDDVIQNHQERMSNLKKYYPFFKLMDMNFLSYKEGQYEQLDMGYLVMAVLRFLIEYNHFQDSPVLYEDYRNYMALVLKRDFELDEAAVDDELIQYIFDKMDNDGRPFQMRYFDPVDHQLKMLRMRLIESELKDKQVWYRISADAVAFYLETKEVREESRINVAQLLLEKMIRSKNFKGGLEVISRINMEVGRLFAEAASIQTLLNRHVQEGLKELEAYHERLLKWFDEEQRLFNSNMALTAQAMKKVSEEMTGGSRMDEIYQLDTALKNATRKHAQLMQLYVHMQQAGDEALARAKRTRFRSSVDFIDLWNRIRENDTPQMLSALVMPLFAPKINQTFELSRLDDLLLYKPDELAEGERIVKEKERKYVYEDEVAQARIIANTQVFLLILLEELLNKPQVMLSELNELYKLKLSSKVVTNGDYYAFLVHLSQKSEYDLSEVAKQQDTFLEGMMADFLKEQGSRYGQLKFRLVFLPKDVMTIMDQYTMTNIRFERIDA